MNEALKSKYQNEIALYQETLQTQNYSASWNHLERAHILGQYFIIPHVETHWLMFLLAIRTANLKELIAQIPRLILAAPGSMTGKAPKGNPGSARVGIFTPCEIPEDLRSYL